MTGSVATAESEPIAYESEEAPTDADLIKQYVTFACAGKAYGIDIMQVREIRSWSQTTELPGEPHGARGVLDIRGEVLQVYDLKVLLGGGPSEVTDGHVVVVVSINGVQAGILADSVSDIIQVGKDDMRKAPHSRGGASEMVQSLAKHNDKIVAILDLRSLLAPDEYVEL